MSVGRMVREDDTPSTLHDAGDLWEMTPFILRRVTTVSGPLSLACQELRVPQQTAS